MQSLSKQSLLNCQLRVWFLSLFAVALMPVSTFCQSMFGNTTVYTDIDATEGSPTIHAWGYTSSPAVLGGPAATHTYTSTTNIVLPSGASASSTGYGEDYTPAISNTYLTVPLSDLINGYDGDLYIETQHRGDCSFSGNFLNTLTLEINVRFAITTMEWTGVHYPGGNLKVCDNIPACFPPGTPLCGAGGIHVTVPLNQTCYTYAQSVFFVRSSGACVGLGLYHEAIGPGYCTR